MELRVLRYFLAVARAGSFTAAAHALHVTQPTLSRQLKDLEAELGATLFVRHSHSVSLTADGQRLRERAAEIVELLEKTEAEFTFGTCGLEADIHIGWDETRGIRHITRLMREMRQEYPRVRFHMHSGTAQDTAERLGEGLLDFGLLGLGLPGCGLSAQFMDARTYTAVSLPETDTWGLLLRKDTPLAARPGLTRGDLHSQPLLLPRRATQRAPEKNALTAWFKEDIKAVEVAGTYDTLYGAAVLVAAGVGHALTTESAATATHEATCFRPLVPPLTSRPHVVWKKSPPLSAMAELFAQRVQQSFGGVVYAPVVAGASASFSLSNLA